MIQRWLLRQGWSSGGLWRKAPLLMKKHKDNCASSSLDGIQALWQQGSRGPCHSQKMSQPSDGSQRRGSGARSISGCRFWRQKLPRPKAPTPAPGELVLTLEHGQHRAPAAHARPSAPAKDQRDVSVPIPLHVRSQGRNDLSQVGQESRNP